MLVYISFFITKKQSNIMSRYFFDPLKYGFEPLSMFPEIEAAGAREHLGTENDFFVRVFDFSKKSESDKKACYFIICAIPPANSTFEGDHRVKLYEHALNHILNKFTISCSAQLVYFGTVSSNDFAELLLSNLFTPYSNDALPIGKLRLQENLNEKFRLEWGTENF